MRDRVEKNLSAVMEYPLNFERYIEMRLKEIDDLDERRQAKEVLWDGLGKIIHCMEKKYQELERRVYKETEVPVGCYEVISTIIRKEDYDPTNETLFPVCLEDLQEETEGWEIAENGIYIGTIFLKADEKTARKFENAGDFSGTYGEESVRKAIFHVRRAQRYRDRVELLYHAFRDNHVSWETVHSGYLDKFYDVFMESIGQLDMLAELACIKVNYGEYGEFIRQDIIPLWNVEQISFDSTDFMLPCIDGIYYEHEFDIRDADPKDGYLVVANIDILEIRHEEGKILMKTKEETFEDWQALRIVQKQTEKSLDYIAPLLSNHRKDSYFRRISGETPARLLTKADLFRRVAELDIGEYIEMTGYKLCNNVADYPKEEGMDWFVEDGLFPMESRRVLVLEFAEKSSGHYLNDSMVRFAVSRIQLEVEEYRCVGVITNLEKG